MNLDIEGWTKNESFYNWAEQELDHVLDVQVEGIMEQYSLTEDEKTVAKPVIVDAMKSHINTPLISIVGCPVGSVEEPSPINNNVNHKTTNFSRNIFIPFLINACANIKSIEEAHAHTVLTQLQKNGIHTITPPKHTIFRLNIAHFASS